MGLLELINPKISKTPGYRGLDIRRNAIGQFGLGMIGGGGLDKMRNAVIGGMQGRQVDSAYALEQQKQRDAQDQFQQAEQAKNQTVEWMRASTPQSFAQLQAGLPMNEAFKLAQQEYQQATAPQEQGQRRIVEGADGYKYYEDGSRVIPGIEAAQGAPLVNIEGNTVPQIGTIPQGWEVITDQTGNRLMRPIPGGPAAVEAQQTAQQDQFKQDLSSTYADIVTQDLDRLSSAIKDNPAMTTGIGAAITQGIAGTPAFNAKALADTVRANVGFDKLQQMRDSSPTGGALGQVSELENRLLQATIGNLELSQNSDQLLFNLNRVKEIYARIINQGINPNDPVVMEILQGNQQGQNIGTGTTSTGLNWSIQ